MTFGYEFCIIFVMFLNIDQYREVSIQFVLPFIFIVVIDIICNIVCDTKVNGYGRKIFPNFSSFFFAQEKLFLKGWVGWGVFHCIFTLSCSMFPTLYCQNITFICLTYLLGTLVVNGLLNFSYYYCICPHIFHHYLY
ncbi:hypothetical protein ACJX0J_012450 [Zea mays]